MTYEQWEAGVPDVIRRDSLWKMEAYRLGLFLSDLGWRDAGKLARDRRTVGIADQLYPAVGKISSNFGEGYSRASGKERAHFYEYALGSAREARDWYHKGRGVLSEAVVKHRLDLCARIVRLALKMIARERTSNRKVSPAP